MAQSASALGSIPDEEQEEQGQAEQQQEEQGEQEEQATSSIGNLLQALLAGEISQEEYARQADALTSAMRERAASA